MRRYTNAEQSKQQASQPLSPHHSPNKITMSFPPQATHYDEQDSTTPVQIYLHSHNAKSFKIQLSPKISITEIKTIVADKMGVRKDRQLLYLNGKNITEYGHIRLQPLSIIHISNIDELCDSNQEIQLRVTILNFLDDKQEKVYKKYTARPNERVSDFLNRLEKDIAQIFTFSGKPAQYFLLQSSRLLQRQKTFAEQEVTRQSEVICMLTKHEVKTRFTNDTKQQILHDISELLGFSEDTQSKPEPRRDERAMRPRYMKEQQKKTEYTKEVQDEPQSYSSAHSLSSFTIPNFKKKSTPICKAASFDQAPNTPLFKKIKSSKSKRDLDLLLNSQKNEKTVFLSPDAIGEEAKQAQKRPEQPLAKQTIADVTKPTPQIPKVMPINERRQIKMEIQKLFDIKDSSNSKTASQESIQAKEEKKPISPPTEAPRPKQKMRLSMGSRPAFLDQLRNLKDQ